VICLQYRYQAPNTVVPYMNRLYILDHEKSILKHILYTAFNCVMLLSCLNNRKKTETGITASYSRLAAWSRIKTFLAIIGDSVVPLTLNCIFVPLYVFPYFPLFIYIYIKFFWDRINTCWCPKHKSQFEATDWSNWYIAR
jgi:hypothetical protein